MAISKTGSWRVIRATSITRLSSSPNAAGCHTKENGPDSLLYNYCLCQKANTPCFPSHLTHCSQCRITPSLLKFQTHPGHLQSSNAGNILSIYHLHTSQQQRPVQNGLHHLRTEGVRPGTYWSGCSVVLPDYEKHDFRGGPVSRAKLISPIVTKIWSFLC